MEFKILTAQREKTRKLESFIKDGLEETEISVVYDRATLRGGFYNAINERDYDLVILDNEALNSRELGQITALARKKKTKVVGFTSDLDLAEQVRRSGLPVYVYLRNSKANSLSGYVRGIALKEECVRSLAEEVAA